MTAARAAPVQQSVGPISLLATAPQQKQHPSPTPNANDVPFGLDHNGITPSSASGIAPSNYVLESEAESVAISPHRMVVPGKDELALPTARIPTRTGLDSSPALFLWQSRTTNVDVMSVSNTTRPAAVLSTRNSERRRIQVVLPYRIGGTPIGGGGGRGEVGDPTTTTGFEAQLNEARRAKDSRGLRRERQVFLERLSREREERVSLEAWAATRIQAAFRGFLARPRPPRLRPRKIFSLAEANRRLVADLQAILARAGLPTIPGLGPDGRKASEGSDWGRGRGFVGAEGLGRRSGRGRQSRRQRKFEDEMATRITKVVRGFLERRRTGRRRRAWNLDRRLMAVRRVQRAWRSYRKRRGWHDLEAGVMDCAATTIQARWRGMSCRMALTIRRKRDAMRKRQTVSTVTIQAAVRRRLAVARYGPQLTLVIARREREARAALEAARPRRRWKGGAPASAMAAGTTGSSSCHSVSADSETRSNIAGTSGEDRTIDGSRGSVSMGKNGPSVERRGGNNAGGAGSGMRDATAMVSNGGVSSPHIHHISSAKDSSSGVRLVPSEGERSSEKPTHGKKRASMAASLSFIENSMPAGNRKSSLDVAAESFVVNVDVEIASASAAFPDRKSTGLSDGRGDGHEPLGPILPEILNVSSTEPLTTSRVLSSAPFWDSEPPSVPDISKLRTDAPSKEVTPSAKQADEQPLAKPQAERLQKSLTEPSTEATAPVVSAVALTVQSIESSTAQFTDSLAGAEVESDSVVSVNCVGASQVICGTALG